MDTVIRPAQPDDIPFIYSTWLKSYYCDSKVGTDCRKSVFFDEYKLVIDGILKDPKTRVLVTASRLAPNTIYSYVVLSGATIHYCYSKEDFRGFGLVTRMVRDMQSPCHSHLPAKPTPSSPLQAPCQDNGTVIANARIVPTSSPARIVPPPHESRGVVIICTHKTFSSRPIFAKYPNLLVYNPFKLYKGASNE